jgi:RND family efflux transporter MFP subunit
VRVAVAEEKSHVAKEEIVGTVRATLRATIEAKISARIERMLARPGENVQAGQLLVQLDSREIQSRLDQALPVLHRNELELKRYKSLVEQNAAARSELDAVEARYQVAQAAVKEAQTQLTYSTIVAPFDGVITRKLADVGDHAAPGKGLSEIEDPRVLRVEADVPESLIQNLELGMKLLVNRSEAQTAAIEAAVSEIAPAADVATRTFLVKADLPTNTFLRAGQFARISIPRGERRMLMLPVSAVVQRGQMELAFVVSNGIAHLRLIKTGSRLGSHIEVVSGIANAETVVVDPSPGSLRDGQSVEVKL